MPIHLSVDWSVAVGFPGPGAPRCPPLPVPARWTIRGSGTGRALRLPRCRSRSVGGARGGKVPDRGWQPAPVWTCCGEKEASSCSCVRVACTVVDVGGGRQGPLWAWRVHNGAAGRVPGMGQERKQAQELQRGEATRTWYFTFSAADLLRKGKGSSNVPVGSGLHPGRGVAGIGNVFLVVIAFLPDHAKLDCTSIGPRFSDTSSAPHPHTAVCGPRLTCRASDQFTISDVNIPQYCIDGIRSSSFDTRLLRRPVSFFVVRMGYNFVLVLFPKNTPSPW